MVSSITAVNPSIYLQQNSKATSAPAVQGLTLQNLEDMQNSAKTAGKTQISFLDALVSNFKSIDADGNGSITKSEFTQYLHNKKYRGWRSLQKHCVDYCRIVNSKEIFL